MLYDESWLARVAVKYKAGIRRYISDDAVAWRHRASGRDSRLQSQADIGQAAVIEEVAGDRADDGDNRDWDLPREDRRVPDVCRNEQQVLFHRVSELGWLIGVMVHGEGSSSLKLVEYGFHMQVVSDRLAHEAFDMCSTIGKQAETNYGFWLTKNDLEREISNAPLGVQAQT